jgi:hypothetical protein
VRGAGSTRHYEWSTPSHGKIVVCQVLALISVHVKDRMRSVAQKQYELVCMRVQKAHVCWTAKKPCGIVKTDNVWIGRRYMLVWYHEICLYILFVDHGPRRSHRPMRKGEDRPSCVKN